MGDLRRRLRELVDYPTAAVNFELLPDRPPETVWDLARGFAWETGLDPIRCTLEKFEEVKEAYSTVGVIDEVQELLPELRLLHVACVVGDVYRALAEELEKGGEEVLDGVHFALDDPEERALAEEDRRERIKRYRQKARAHFHAAERSIGLEELSDPDLKEGT